MHPYEGAGSTLAADGEEDEKNKGTILLLPYLGLNDGGQDWVRSTGSHPQMQMGLTLPGI